MYLKFPSFLFNEAGPADGGGGDMGGGDDFGSLLSQEVNQAVQEHNNPQQEKPQPKEQAPKPDVPEKPKKLTEKLGAVEEEQVEEVPEKKEEADDEPPTYKARVPTEKEKATWAGLKRDSADLKTVRTELETLKSELETARKSGVPKELEAELAELRQIRDVHDIRQSPEYKQTVTEPFARIESEVDEIAGEFKVDSDKVWKAIQEKTEWKRNRAISAAMAESEGEVTSDVLTALYNAGNRAHSIWQKGSELDSKAAEIRAAREVQSGQQQSQMTQKQEAEWKEASGKSVQMLEKSLAPILKGMDAAAKTELMTALQEAKISDDPAERALQAHSPHVAAVLIQTLNAKNKELATLRRERDGLLNSKPKLNQNHGEQVKKNMTTDEEDEEFTGALRNEMRSIRQG